LPQGREARFVVWRNLLGFEPIQDDRMAAMRLIVPISKAMSNSPSAFIK
jgi:hypothetical protein